MNYVVNNNDFFKFDYIMKSEKFNEFLNLTKHKNILPNFKFT